MEKNLSTEMHKDLFDRCSDAIQNKYFFEALLLEYSAIEGRLEVILGVLGLPCNKELDTNLRKNIKISHRINCLNHIRKSSSNFNKTKLESNFFSKNGRLQKWIRKRNVFVHGLYKSSDDYINRLNEVNEIATEGFEIVRLLYNESKRLRRLNKNHPDRFETCSTMCKTDSCDASIYKKQK